jgi:branched-chain amino acid transport system substrate-binding protein
MRRSLNILLTLLLLLLPACGPAPYTCADPLGCLEIPPDQPLLIGVTLTVTGEQADRGLTALQGIQEAVAEQAELLGHPLELARQDSDCSPDDARRAATSLALEAGLVAVIGPSCPADLETIAPLLTEAGLPLLTPASPCPRPYLLARRLFEAILQVAYQAGDGTLFLPRQALTQALQNTP